jgi:pimeloyl-ACP methyl ester carboxylesterase
MSHLADIDVPALVACFEHDLLFPPAGGRNAAAAIPHGSFVEIPGAAHAGLMTHPELCIDAIVNFIESV